MYYEESANKIEITFLDFIEFYAESWKVLVGGALAAFSMTFLISLSWPKQYESYAIIKLSDAELALVNMNPVLDGVIDQLKLPEFSEGDLEDARQKLSKKIKTKLDKKTGLATLTVVAETPKLAQQIAISAVESLQVNLLPKGEKKIEIQEHIAINKKMINELEDVKASLIRLVLSSKRNNNYMDERVNQLLVINKEILDREVEIARMQRSLDTTREDVYVQKANFPNKAMPQKRMTYVIIVTVVVVALLMIFILIKKILQKITADQNNAEQLLRIKSYLKS